MDIGRLKLLAVLPILAIAIAIAMIVIIMARTCALMLILRGKARWLIVPLDLFSTSKWRTYRQKIKTIGITP
jgi:hypothetical protein